MLPLLKMAAASKRRLRLIHSEVCRMKCMDEILVGGESDMCMMSRCHDSEPSCGKQKVRSGFEAPNQDR
jgi:hypothetical protein